MAHTVHYERQDTDPIPLRRVVRQRPLTDREVDDIYGRHRMPVWQPVSARVSSDEAIEIPMHRPRWGFVVVALVLLPALALLGYAISLRSEAVARALGVGEPELVLISAEPLGAVAPLDVSSWLWVVLEGTSAEPHRGPGIEAAEEIEAPKRRPRRTARPAAPPAPAETETVYPSLDPPSAEIVEPVPEPAPPAEPPPAVEPDGILRDPGF